MLSKNLKKYREEKNLTKAQLAELSKISERTIYFIESGETPNPQLSTLKSLAVSLDVTIEALIT